MVKTNPSRGGLYAIPTVGYFRGRRRLRGWQRGAARIPTIRAAREPTAPTALADV